LVERCLADDVAVLATTLRRATFHRTSLSRGRLSSSFRCRKRVSS